MGRPVGRCVVGLTMLLAVVSACSDDSGESCDALRAEYERLQPVPEASTAWSDIQSLQEKVAERLAQQARIADRCG